MRLRLGVACLPARSASHGRPVVSAATLLALHGVVPVNE